VFGDGKQYAVLMGGGEGQQMGMMGGGMGFGGAVNGNAGAEFSVQLPMQNASPAAQVQQPALVSDEELKRINQEIDVLKKELSGKPEVKELLTKHQNLQTEHRKRLDRRAQALSKSFNINQWKVSRKK
jgi:hypothetical protein